MAALTIFKRKPSLDLTQDQKEQVRNAGIIQASNWGLIMSPALVLPGILLQPLPVPELAQAFTTGGILAGAIAFGGIGYGVLKRRSWRHRQRFRDQLQALSVRDQSYYRHLDEALRK